MGSPPEHPWSQAVKQGKGVLGGGDEEGQNPEASVPQGFADSLLFASGTVGGTEDTAGNQKMSLPSLGLETPGTVLQGRMAVRKAGSPPHPHRHPARWLQELLYSDGYMGKSSWHTGESLPRLSHFLQEAS